jgi:hypothetical protein
MMMVKEHFIKQFGLSVHTIGVGDSGGSTHPQLIAQNFPGLLDGILRYSRGRQLLAPRPRPRQRHAAVDR